jgi:Zn-dependent metalloprotease
MTNEAIKNRLINLRKFDPKLQVTYSSDRTVIAVLRGKLSRPVNLEKLAKAPYEYARQLLKENAGLFGDVNQKTGLVNERVLIDRRNMTHVIFSQKHGDAQVIGSTISVHYQADGTAYLIKSSLASKIDIPKKPKISVDEAAKIALKHAGPSSQLFEGLKPSLVVMDSKTAHLNEQKHYLCWKMGVLMPPKRKEAGYYYYIDAIKGRVLLRITAVQTGTGTGHYSTGTALNSEASGTTFRLRDDQTSSGWPEATKPVIHTYDDHNSNSFTLTNYSEDSDDDWDDVGTANRYDDQGPEVDLHRFMGYVLEYYYLIHGYNGWDGAGSDIKGHVHNSYYVNNAFWYGLYHQIYFGDGNGTTRDFFTPLDTVAHEYTHGVQHYFNILQNYEGETGAVNEAISDLFGAFLALNHPADDPWPWHHSRQYRLDGSIGRDMIDPSRDDAGVVQYDSTNNNTKKTSAQNGYYPDHYSIRYNPPTPWDNTNDYGGVHWNAPIITHCVYLMINGGTHRLSNVTVTGIGVGPVEEMLYHVISAGLLDNTSEFKDFRTAFILACQTLYPEDLDYLVTVKNAFFAVGIGPDLYIRDNLADQGEEPGILSCMSPDIIVRQQQADAATLVLIGDVNNSSLGQEIELGPNDHYIYFRLFNRGFSGASGTFRLFISPVSTFPTPATWHEVGTYDFPEIADGGFWVPTTTAECITLTSALINTLGTGHFCFIGIIECDDDRPPDRSNIDNVSEFHDYISMSNNYAWRNCNIIDLVPDASGDVPVTSDEFMMNGYGRWHERRTLEIDTGALPENTQFQLLLPETHAHALNVLEYLPRHFTPYRVTYPGTLEPQPITDAARRIVPITQMRKPVLNQKVVQLTITPKKIINLTGLTIRKDDQVKVRFQIKFPKNVGTRDVALVFREKYDKKVIGQMNYIYRIRKSG